MCVPMSYCKALYICGVKIWLLEYFYFNRTLTRNLLLSYSHGNDIIPIDYYNLWLPGSAKVDSNGFFFSFFNPIYWRIFILAVLSKENNKLQFYHYHLYQ